MHVVIGQVALDYCQEGLHYPKQIKPLFYLKGVSSVLVIFFYSLFIL